nr:MAG TPA: hypothetical protein [Caudoviricetes sp.]
MRVIFLSGESQNFTTILLLEDITMKISPNVAPDLYDPDSVAFYASSFFENYFGVYLTLQSENIIMDCARKFGCQQTGNMINVVCSLCKDPMSAVLLIPVLLALPDEGSYTEYYIKPTSKEQNTTSKIHGGVV